MDYLKKSRLLKNTRFFVCVCFVFVVVVFLIGKEQRELLRY